MNDWKAWLSRHLVGFWQNTPLALYALLSISLAFFLYCLAVGEKDAAILLTIVWVGAVQEIRIVQAENKEKKWKELKKGWQEAAAGWEKSSKGWRKAAEEARSGWDRYAEMSEETINKMGRREMMLAEYIKKLHVRLGIEQEEE